MSVEALFKAFKIQGLTSAEKVVLLVLADSANDKLECWPSQERLGEYSSLSRRTVGRCLQVLEDKGLISRRGSLRKGGTRTTDTIRLEFVQPRDKAEKPNKTNDKKRHSAKLADRTTSMRQDGASNATPVPFECVTMAQQNLPNNLPIEPARAREPCEEARPTRPTVEQLDRARALREEVSAALLAKKKDPRDQSHRMRIRAQ